MSGALGGADVNANVLSHEDVTGVGYGVCTFYPRAKDAYVDLAKNTITHYVKTGEKLAVPEIIPDEMKNTCAGVFVSIHKNGELRGCIGTIAPTKPSVAQEIISNAISAASRDPRFNPITEDELSQLEINVDVLGEPEQISSLDELDVKRYGVIVSNGFRRGLLLPDLDGVDSVEQQVRIARAKGDIRQDEPIILHRFEVIRHK
jgi:AmmeMemoRadiSam system protein A